MLFINIDGCNGVGKTTTIKHLKEKLEGDGLKVKVVHFHRRGTLIGDTIQKVLNKEVEMEQEALQMLYAVDKLEFSNSEYLEIEKENYDVLITDRYDTSSLAIGTAMGINLGHLQSFNLFLKKPYINFILYAEPEVIMQRVQLQENVEGQTGDIFEAEANLKKIIKSYRNLKNVLDNVIEVDTTVSTSQSANEIYSHIKRILEFKKAM